MENDSLFERIIFAVKQEQEFKQTGTLLVFLMCAFAISTVSFPFSLMLFARQWALSGAWYFIITGAAHADMFFAYWQDFILSIFETLPVMAIIALALNAALVLFLLRLFLYKKGLLIKYVKHHLA